MDRSGALGSTSCRARPAWWNTAKFAKLKLRESLLDLIPRRGDEIVLDVGCGRGLLLNGAARRLTTGGFILKFVERAVNCHIKCDWRGFVPNSVRLAMPHYLRLGTTEDPERQRRVRYTWQRTCLCQNPCEQSGRVLRREVRLRNEEANETATRRLA